ncbi:unnamed protein product, partial [Mesorhabditis belari]|uniref:Uncharacterized protein n=1 Tax=Mesorhabditis belari TaxID=2138241 RepID=A0AAF3F4E3_9BILA
MPKVSESSDDGWPAPTKRQPRVVPTSVHQPRESSNLMRAEISDVKHRRFELHYESDKNESAFRFQQKELAAANGQSLTKHDEQKSEMRSVSSFLDKQPRNDTMLYQETDLKAEDYYELEQKVALLKRVHRGEFILLNEDLTKDQLLLSALTWNMDFLNICETVVAPAPKYQGMDSSILPWRIENHAVYYDLIDFVQPGKDLPQMATPITFLEPQLLLCVGFDEKSNNKEQVQTTLKRILDDGFILDPLQEIVYGVKALWKCPDDGKYIRVVTLALDNNIGAREEAWVVTCLDSVCLERDKTFVVQGSELFVIPDQLSIKNIPAQLFIMQLRGLDHIREVSIILI